MRLSIVIPYYNSKAYTDELLKVLNPQVTEDVEVILVDDGSPKPYKTRLKGITVIRKENGGCASARNLGLEYSTGEYVAFVDSDDLVSKDYVNNILFITEDEKPDVIEVSWKSLNNPKQDRKLNKDSDRLTNNSVWCRVLKREFIGDHRFNEYKDTTEDEDFTRHLGIRDKKPTYTRLVIPEYMYFYRDVENSKIKRFKQGIMRTKRVTYYYKEVKKDRTDILESIKKDDEHDEVILLTEKCEIPALERYCQIYKPMHLWTHIQKGEPYDDIEIIGETK